MPPQRFLKFIKASKPDVVCCQETKVNADFRLATPGYTQIWNHGKRPGYAGTLVLTMGDPLSYTLGMGIEKFDAEGRLITVEYEDYYILNVYAPSIHENNTPGRPDYRREWDEALREYVGTLSKPIIMCGDFNATSTDIDTYPKPDRMPDDIFFLPETRDGFNKLLATGFVDVFRSLYPTKEGDYTWWGPKHKNRQENRGTRLDYFLVSEELFPFVQSITHHVDVLGSDHCPLSFVIRPITVHQELSEEDLAVRWRSTDWSVLEEELFEKQKISQAADVRNWEEVKILQDELVNSYAAKMLAVRDVADKNSAAGVDGVRFKTDVQKMKAVLSLTSKGYRPLPNRYMEIVDRGKEITLHIPTARDRAMLKLYSYELAPVAEATADNRSFFSRIGRSLHDAQAYLMQDLSGDDAPEFVLRGDISKFFGSTPHDWLIKIFLWIPMC